MVVCLVTDFSLSEKWCIVCVGLANATYLVHENAEWHDTLCVATGIHTYQVMIVSVVAWLRGFHQMTKKMNESMASACLPCFPLCTQPNDTQDAAAGYQKGKHGHHCNLMIIIIIIHKLTSQNTHFELNQNGMWWWYEPYFHLKENSMKMLFPTLFAMNSFICL